MHTWDPAHDGNPHTMGPRTHSFGALGSGYWNSVYYCKLRKNLDTTAIILSSGPRNCHPTLTSFWEVNEV